MLPAPPAAIEPAAPAVRVDALLGAAIGLDAAVGLHSFPLRVCLTAIAPRLVQGLSASDLMWRAGAEWRLATDGGFSFDSSLGAGAFPLSMFPGQGPVGMSPFACGGFRLTWRASELHLALSPQVAVGTGSTTLGDLGGASLLGSAFGVLPPLVEIGWRPVPGITLTARSSLAFLGLRFEL